MALRDDEIEWIITDRLMNRWPKHFMKVGAAPYAVVGVVQRPGPDFGTPTITIPDGMDERMVAELLLGVAMKLLDELKRRKHGHRN